ncbi:MAG: hypothetical protein K2N34_00270, partial [Lachnospiraceae bacterium]|nr:hypothetical protein [Lachnospiraceae bacterium]
MKNLIMVIFAATLILSGFVDCYAADELSEREAREQIAYYMEGQRIADADNSFEELALQEYDMDCMVKTYKMSEMLKTYNKGGKFKDTLSDVKYFVPGITKSGEYCYFTFEVKDGKIEAADGAFGLEYFYDCRFDESKYPQLAGEKVKMVEYGYNLPYGCIFTHVKTDKNEYIIQYSESLIHEITGIKSGELLYAKDFYKIM